jgi:DNA polymerase III subunit epsilon
MYAIVDIETTGGQPEYDRIIEIAVYLHDGNRITGEFSSLVNPGVSIPPFIARLTRISDEMVASAPDFETIAPEIVRLLENRVFVAHNVMFDFSFLNHALQKAGYAVDAPLLCTCKTSRRLLPGHPSYSLGKLCRSLSINLENAHRAAADALATTSILELLIDKAQGVLDPFFYVPEPRQNFSGIPESELEKLPPRAGIIYFVNEDGEVIYITRSKNIRKKARTIVGKMKNKRYMNVAVNARHLDFEVTGSRVLAAIRESEEILKFSPRFNRKYKQRDTRFAIYEELDSCGHLTLATRPYQPGTNPVIILASQKEADKITRQLVIPHLPGHQEAPNSHLQNRQVGEIISSLVAHRKNFIISDLGPVPSQQTHVVVRNGCYAGFLICDRDDVFPSAEELLERMITSTDHPSSFRAIVNTVARGHYERIIHF